jgi:hypothetical protein
MPVLNENRELMHNTLDWGEVFLPSIADLWQELGWKSYSNPKFTQFSIANRPSCILPLGMMASSEVSLNMSVS